MRTRQISKLIIGLAALLFPLVAGAQQVERVYVSTDRNVYLAGERVWCSLFCVDGQDRLVEKGSAVCYLELVSAEGTAVEAKAGMMEGRGAGSFTLPSTLPTGNYRLLAYTGTGSVSPSGSRLLSVYNPFTVRRVKEGVDLSATWEAPELAVEDDPALQVRTAPDGGISLQSDSPMSLSVSLIRCDALRQLPLPSIRDFLSARENLPGGEPEYDGEVIRGHVFSVPEGAQVYLSSAGSVTDTYVGRVDAAGKVRFATGNIYGDRELVTEVEGGSENTFIVLESPFLHPQAGEVPRLVLSPVQEEALLARKSVLHAPVRPDTLALPLSHREDLLFEGMPWEIYNLDDYTRFPSVPEILVELLPGVRVRRVHDRQVFTMVASDGADGRKYRKDNILAMMDGVVLTDLDPLLHFDAMLLDRVEVCNRAFVIGRTPFEGAINFVSKNLYVTSLTFPDRVRVTDFRGVSYPVALTGAVPENSYTLYWNPLCSLPGGQAEVSLGLSIPKGDDNFLLVIEGVAGDARPVREIVLINRSQKK